MKHPNVDVDDELARMRVWMSSPKGEKRDGKILFITTWLKNALEKRPVIREEPNKNSALSLLDIDPLWEKYLEGLWENCEHILEFNTMRR